jgi:hypothetical protein
MMTASELVSKARLQAMAGCCVGPQGEQGDPGPTNTYGFTTTFASSTTGTVAYPTKTYTTVPIAIAQVDGSSAIYVSVYNKTTTGFSWKSSEAITALNVILYTGV